MALSAVYTGNSNGDIWHKVQVMQIILTGTYGTKFSLYTQLEWGNMAQSSGYADTSNGDIWHKVQVMQIILTGTYGTKFIVYRYF